MYGPWILGCLDMLQLLNVNLTNFQFPKPWLCHGDHLKKRPNVDWHEAWHYWDHQGYGS